MTAWKIFIAAVRHVLDNWRVALRISGALFAVQWVMVQALGLAFGNRMAVAGPDDAATLVALKALLGPTLLSFVVLLVTYVWIAVAWHRYALKGEISPTFIPLFEGRRMLAYLGTLLALSVGIGLLTAGVMLVLITLLRSNLLLGLGAVLPILVQILMGSLALRMSTVLAGVALEPGHRLVESWRATRGQGAQFVLLAVICAGLLAVAQAVEMLLGVLPPVQLVFSIVVQWVVAMVGVSILTTLYAHFILRRPLD